MYVLVSAKYIRALIFKAILEKITFIVLIYAVVNGLRIWKEGKRGLSVYIFRFFASFFKDTLPHGIEDI